MKCDTCVYCKTQFGNEEIGYYEGHQCQYPDEDISIINNEALLQGKPINECCDYEAKSKARDEHCKEKSMLDKAEEMRQGEVSNA